VNLRILEAIGAPPTVVLTEEDWAREKLEVIDADIVVDALFGTGLTKPVTGLLRNVIVNLFDDFPVSDDRCDRCSSGLSADNTELIGPAVPADVTVTFTALKLCLALPPSHQYAGDVIVADIGNPERLLEEEQYQLNLITTDLFPAVQHLRPQDSNKGSYGKILVIGGSRGKSGAAAMAGQAALRSGGGLVTVATPASILPIIAATLPELMTESLQENSEGTVAKQSVAKLLEGKTVLLSGRV
jgi:NAD(P)H-hydrate epimerase